MALLTLLSTVATRSVSQPDPFASGWMLDWRKASAVPVPQAPLTCRVVCAGAAVVGGGVGAAATGGENGIVDDTPSFGRMLWRGVTRRCPRCGAGHLFSRWFRMADRCPRCGHRFQREEGFQLGAYVINFGVTEGLVCLALLGYILAAAANPDVSSWPCV